MQRSTDRFEAVERKIVSGQCVVLDGATGTELPQGSAVNGLAGERLWGADALASSPDSVLSVHRRYAEAGCDIISTDTWGLPNVLHDSSKLWEAAGPVHWMDLARRGIGVARRAAADAGRADDCAVAFSLSGKIDTPESQETIRLLDRMFEDESPDLILVETLSLVRPSTYETVERLLETGLPIWLSFRRCRHGLCGVFGEHWGGPEGDSFGRAARRFEEMGVGALLINCIPPDHVNGMLPWLRDFTDLPLGVYPNLGYLSQSGWLSDTGVGGPEYAEMALRWREEGAQIVGGCCGVGPEHIEAARDVLADAEVGDDRLSEDHLELNDALTLETRVSQQPVSPWTDERGRSLFPLEFPDIVCEPGVFVPTQGSFFMWRHLFKEGIGADQRCLDVGCGTGLLTVQLAFNGAKHVHAIDLEELAVANARASALRNGVADRVTAESVDLYPWVPEERYEVIVASLYQMPVDPFEQGVTHRPRDYWGRSLLDHLIRKLPEVLAPEGVAYLLQLSILGQERTAELLEEQGLKGRVADFGFFPFTEPFREQREQILRVENFSDAYHLRLADEDVMVAYLLEITHKEPTRGREAAASR